MKIVWKLLVVLGVLATAAAAVALWMRSRKKDVEFDEDCCVWEDDECNCEEGCEE